MKMIKPQVQAEHIFKMSFNSKKKVVHYLGLGRKWET